MPNRNTGAYTINNVPSGFYTVRFTAAPGFVALSSAMPLVQTNQTATAGTTCMTYTNAASGIHGLATWQREGKMCSHRQLAGNPSADSLRIVALSSTPDGTDVVLRIKPFTSVGTYSLSSSNTLAVFRRYLPTTIANFACTGAGTSGALSWVMKRPHAPWLERLTSRPYAAHHRYGRRYRRDY